MSLVVETQVLSKSRMKLVPRQSNGSNSNRNSGQCMGDADDWEKWTSII